MIATMKEIKTMYHGGVPSYASMGRYPLFFVASGRALCPDCASKLDNEEVVAYDVLWENPERMCCDECGCVLEAAYESEALDE